MWYGLLSDNELIRVVWMPATRTPSLIDFDAALNSETEYQIVRAEIHIGGPVAVFAAGSLQPYYYD